MTDGSLILLVDDFEDALDIYRPYLIHRGYRVVVARDGAEAVAMAREHRPDLILLDLSMPVLSGTDAMRILRAERAFDGCPIIALTARALESERATALLSGFDEVIAKPCLPDELAAAVARILRERSAAPLILIATDLPDHARSYQAALVGEGYRVHVVRTGGEALRAAATLRPACAVIDVGMRDMSGWEVCVAIKAQAENRSIRIIVLTPDLAADGAAGSVNVGCHAWLMQPTVAGELVTAVRQVLEAPADTPPSAEAALLGGTTCPACASLSVRATVRVAAVQYYSCRDCRLCWRVETAVSV